MTKIEAQNLAFSHGLCVYKSETIAQILHRINRHIESENFKAAKAAARRKEVARQLARAAHRRFYRPAAVQLALPMIAPRNWSIVSGIAA